MDISANHFLDFSMNISKAIKKGVKISKIKNAISVQYQVEQAY
jgi:hypothetical protein